MYVCVSYAGKRTLAALMPNGVLATGKDVSAYKEYQTLGTHGFKPCVTNGMLITTATMSGGTISKLKAWLPADKWLGYNPGKVLDTDIKGTCDVWF